MTIGDRDAIMFDQSYQQLYLEKQIISLDESYPCPRCKSGHLEPFGDTETFCCGHCSRKFVALNAGRILFPATRLKIKIAPIFWWDGVHWHLAGTTATPSQSLFVLAMFIVPMLAINAFVFFINQGHPVNHASHNLILNLVLLNILTAFFVAQLFYLFCWDQNWAKGLHYKRQVRQ
jgi:hypothetical protein